MSMSRRIGRDSPLLRIAAPLGALALVLAACGTDDPDDAEVDEADEPEEEESESEEEPESDSEEEEAAGSDETTTIRFGTVAQAAVFSLYTAIDQGFFEERGIEFDIVPYADFDALYTAYRAGEVECGAGGLPSSVDLYASGVPVQIIYGSNIVTNDVLVPVDSDIEGFADLEGKRLGVFGGPQGSSANTFLAVNRAYFGFDPLTDAEVQFGAPGVLAASTESGDLDAYLSIDPVAAQGLAAGTFRSIGDTGDIFEENEGFPAYIGSYECMTEFAEENPQAVTGFIEAIQDAVTYLGENDEPWAQVLEEHFEITDPDVVEAMIDRTRGKLPLEWGEDVIDQQVGYLEFLQEHSEEGFLEEIDRDVFTFEYMPEGS